MLEVARCSLSYFQGLEQTAAVAITPGWQRQRAELKAHMPAAPAVMQLLLFMCNRACLADKKAGMQMLSRTEDNALMSSHMHSEEQHACLLLMLASICNRDC